MKKAIGIIFTVLFVASSGLVLACDMNDNLSKKGKTMTSRQGWNPHKEYHHMGMCPLGEAWNNQNIISTSDGGVVVVQGDTLTKYDKNLRLIKTVEFPANKTTCLSQKDCPMGCPMMKAKTAEDAAMQKDKICPMMTKTNKDDTADPRDNASVAEAPTTAEME